MQFGDENIQPDHAGKRENSAASEREKTQTAAKVN
jgi:hypothetical protein